jgi:hypothetical protein
MTPRWIIPDPKYKGELKLVVCEKRPIDAICEAPHNFTDEMEPYFIISHSYKVDGKRSVEVGWDRTYLRDLKRGTLRKKGHKPTPEKPKIADHTEHIVKAKMKRKEFFNSLKPHQRFAYSIFGPLFHNPPGVWRPFLHGIIDKDKLDGAEVGFEIDV